MNRQLRFEHHGALVESWLLKSAKNLDKTQLIELFGQAVRLLIKTTSATLSQTTLNPILDRVLYNSAQRYPALNSVELKPSLQLELEGLKKISPTVSDDDLANAFHFFITEFIVVLGILTAEQITGQLHDELKKITFSSKPAAKT